MDSKKTDKPALAGRLTECVCTAWRRAKLDQHDESRLARHPLQSQRHFCDADGAILARVSGDFQTSHPSSEHQTEVYMTEQRAYAKGRSWWVTAEKPQGGFVLVREDAIFTAWAALCDEKIELRDFRIWLASFEVLERRIGLRADRTPTYTEVEFRRLVGGVGREHFRTSVRRLERAGLGQWRENRIDLPESRSAKGIGGG